MAVTNNDKLHNCGGFSIAHVDLTERPFRPAVLGDGVEKVIMVGGVNTIFPNQCFLSDDVFAATSLCGPHKVVVLYDKAHGKSARLPAPRAAAEWPSISVAAAANGLIAVLLSSPLAAPVLAVGKVSPEDLSCAEWTFYDKSFGAAGVDVSKFGWEVSQVVPEDPKRTHPFDTIYLHIKEEEEEEEDGKKKKPLAVMIHGGPHSSFSTWFNQEAILYLMSGFNVVMVNYTGSSCYGTESCTALLGKVGTLDVVDCEDAIRATLRKYPANDPENVFLTGGSHGGFLTSNLICRTEEVVPYRAASIRNPVWNLAVSYYTSDIPDWAIIEAGGEDLADDEEKLLCLYRHSPAARVANAKVPLAIFLGVNDRRCPNEQGLSLYRALKALGVPAKVWIYQEGHPFNKPLHKGDSLVNTVLWFYKYMSK